jgi:hypothetical protein
MPERSQVRGKVADIEDRYVLVINKGSDDGVEMGMIFAVMDREGAPVKDPDTGTELGRRPIELLRVKVIDVYPRFSRAATYRVTSPIDGSITSFMQSWGRARIANEQVDNGPTPESVVTVNIGDPVREIGGPA